MKFILIGACPHSVINFRGHLLSKLSGYFDTTIAMASGAKGYQIDKITKVCDVYIDYSVSRNGLNPFKDILTLISFIKSFYMYKPDFILAYTIKPIIWGGIASRIFGKSNFYALITGLGFAFQRGTFLKNFVNLIAKFLYKFALKNSKAVIFQNIDNMNLFLKLNIVDANKCFVVNGSGVDLNHYNVVPMPNKPRFLMIARLIGDKGIREYVDAISVVKKTHPFVEFDLVGTVDPSPDGIPLKEVKIWQSESLINYYGSMDDVRNIIKDSSIFVLPSYHEGIPRTILEAMSMGRPILTTDVPGCRETVVNGVNGWLVKKANVEDLAEKMIWFIENMEQCIPMGKKSRLFVEDKFDVHKVNSEILKILGLGL